MNTYFREVSDMADDQDKLAQEWADALIETGDAEDSGVDPEDPLGGLEDVGDPSEAGSADLGQDDEALADEWAAALADTEQDELKHEKEQEFLSTQTHDYDLTDMGPEAKSGGAGGKRDLDFILDIPLEVSAELGRTKLLINELLQLGQGSVVELNQAGGRTAGNLRQRKAGRPRRSGRHQRKIRYPADGYHQSHRTGEATWIAPRLQPRPLHPCSFPRWIPARPS